MTSGKGSANSSPARRGPKSKAKFTKKHLDRLHNLALLGFTNLEIAGVIERSTDTLTNWIDRFPEVKEAIVSGRQDADAVLAKRLKMRAFGYTHESEEIKLVDHETFDEQGRITSRTKKVLRVPTIKHYPPNETALIFWMTNRQRDKWKRNVLPDGEDSTQIIVNIVKKFTEEGK